MKFRTVIQLHGKSATGIEVPAEIVAALGSGKRPAVQVTLNSYTYRSTIAPMGGAFLLPISAEHRTGAGVKAGDEVEVEVIADEAPREVEVPADLREALAQDSEAQQSFEGLSYSNKRRIVLSVEEAKTAETRQRRIAKAVSQLHSGEI